ncbi:hypothetical protein EXS62_01350 [Candidatus Kaiserbacteria bacterium]|nr:hypothetical protein [Candidatus Kaiserbacteria bacterium]
MDQLPVSITVTVVVLTAFLIFITALKYAGLSEFSRTRLMMTSFFCFIVTTLTISFWPYTLVTLPFTIPACVVGIVLGYALGVRAARQRLSAEGMVHYMEHFAHIHPTHLKNLTWWSLINFYSVMSALVLINLVGFSTVLFRDAQTLAILTSAVGAFLLGTIIPYLIHLWSIKAKHPSTSSTSER